MIAALRSVPRHDRHRAIAAPINRRLHELLRRRLMILLNYGDEAVLSSWLLTLILLLKIDRLTADRHRCDIVSMIKNIDCARKRFYVLVVNNPPSRAHPI